jgi:hypothetical protein
MAETKNFSFTRRDILDLTNELSAFAKETKLGKDKWALLLAIFAAAADHVEVERVGETGKFSGIAIRGNADQEIESPARKTVEELRDQLRGAYIPGKPVAPIPDCVVPPPPPPPPPKNGK